MTLTPPEIKAQVFRKSFRGVDPREVAAFLDRVADEIDGLMQENVTLQGRLDEVETRMKEYQNIEKILQQTLLQAQETGHRAVENARKEAELILQQAEIKSSEMLDKTRRDVTVLKEQITVLLSKKNYIISRMKMLLSSEMETIRQLEADPDLAASSAPQREKPAGGNEFDEIVKNLD